MDEIAHIGSAEANDVYANKNGTFSLVDCRANYSISATSPEKAYQEAKNYLKKMISRNFILSLGVWNIFIVNITINIGTKKI